MAAAGYSAPEGAGRAVVRFAITNVNGPGKYTKPNIQNFVLGWGPVKVWNYNARQDNCTIEFSGLDDSGMAGTFQSSGGGAPAFSEMKFQAAP